MNRRVGLGQVTIEGGLLPDMKLIRLCLLWLELRCVGSMGWDFMQTDMMNIINVIKIMSTS